MDLSRHFSYVQILTVNSKFQKKKQNKKRSEFLCFKRNVSTSSIQLSSAKKIEQIELQT